MFGVSGKKNEVQDVATPPEGVAEIIFCVFDEKFKTRHYYKASRNDTTGTDCFQFLNDSKTLCDSCILREALSTRDPVTLSLSYGDSQRKYLYILPYEGKRGRWNYACLQVDAEAPDYNSVGSKYACALGEDRVCLLLADSQNTIHSVSSSIPAAWGYTARNMMDMNLSDLFSKMDLEVINSCPSDTNESILNCVFNCLEGSRRDVEIKKYSAPDRFSLYIVCDVTRPQLTEEISQISTRERRRIGQDLHDSIGQVLTGISLLSRSLANSLKRAGSPGDEDAEQISALADDASNQIRQISRGLMATEIVHKGLFDSLRDLAETITHSCGLLCDTRLDESIEFADGAVETHLYRIVQEAVNNAVRHSGASRIDIVLSRVKDRTRLEISDNGTWKGETANITGIGMRTMEYRAAAIGGRLRVGVDPQGGTRVICVLEADDHITEKA